MWFLLLGVLGVALKFFEIGPVATLSWWIVLIPFALAMAWWAWADWSGYTKAQVIKKENERKEERIDRQRSRLGMLGGPSGRKRRGKG
ncbi:TIGR04438 family Trp-rich protein [Variovorax humicola]|uniref:TIGR04438 family Trp-rich protein n=1 Tax=Variovorax humicola TaxID=1769758 RepID=A0ABU8VYT3_9BURK